MDLIVQNNLDRLAATLSDYISETGKALDDVLEKKGRDLSIQLFKAFQGKEWGGVPKKRGIAVEELARRTAARKGTKVRATLLEDYAGP